MALSGSIRAHTSKIQLREGRGLTSSRSALQSGGHCSRGATEKVAGAGAKRQHRNAVPKTAHPAEGWQRICCPGGSGTPCRGAAPGGRLYGGVASLDHRLLSGMPTASERASRFSRCVSPAGSIRARGGGDTVDLLPGGVSPAKRQGFFGRHGRLRIAPLQSRLLGHPRDSNGQSLPACFR
jgi:hypothetical protein